MRAGPDARVYSLCAQARQSHKPQPPMPETCAMLYPLVAGAANRCYRLTTDDLCATIGALRLIAQNDNVQVRMHGA